MGLAPWLKTRLGRAVEWSAELAVLRAEVGRGRSAEKVFDLAQASEQCDPDRGRALALYVDAWRAGHLEAAGHAERLAEALRAHMTRAELAAARGDVVAAGTAYLDAGMRDLAVGPLRTALDALGTATPDQRAEATSLLALAEQTPFNIEAAIGATVGTALATRGPAAAPRYAHAIRLARLGAPAKLPGLVAAAARACPDDPKLEILVEDYLLEKNDAADLLDHYRQRFEGASTRAEAVERMRTAGSVLVERGVQPGLGLRLVRLALETTYTALLPDISAHVAAWELLVAHARAQRSTSELMPLLVQALAAPVPEHEALYLTGVGLAIAWRDANDLQAAQPYAATLLDFVPDHPLAIAFLHEIGMTAEPVEPTPPPPPPRATGESPPLAKPSVYADDAPVKRSLPANVVTRTSRLALLKPPPPRSTTLRRDSSPIPMRHEVTGPPRAPRAVVPMDVMVELPNGSFFSTVLRDVSITGAFLTTKRKLDIGLVVALTLQVPVAGTLKQERYMVQAKVVRQTELGFGLAFVDPDAKLVGALRGATT